MITLTKKVYLNENAINEVFLVKAGQSVNLKSVVDDSTKHLSTEQVEWVASVTNNTVHRIECLWMLAEENDFTLTLDISEDLTERNRAFLDDIIQAKSLEKASSTIRKYNSLSEYVCFGIDCIRLLYNMGLSGKRKKQGNVENSYNSIALIGVYGLEHVGDIGILGGVILRINELYGVKHVKLFSTKPEYTQRLASGLDIPVTLDVYPAKAAAYKNQLQHCDAVIWAGGPLMELPTVLIRNLSVIHSMKKQGKPFIIEGIGVGPFKRKISLWSARQIALNASYVNVRTHGDAVNPILENINVTIGCCPAFDYLKTRQQKLTKLSEIDKESVDKLLNKTEGRVLIGLNIRMIRHFYSAEKVGSSKSMENTFLNQLTDGLKQYAQKTNKPVTVIFFPMNLIQVGKSDLVAAYQIQKLLGNEVDMRVWEADPNLDGVLYLLRRLDIALTMRFHACIFAMSQKIPTIGIDYQFGGKVEQLFNDSNLKDDVCRMENLEANWLNSRLIYHSTSNDK